MLRVPDATTFFGCIKDDQFGQILEKKAKEIGVNVKFQYTDKESTGTCAVIVTGNNRLGYIKKALRKTLKLVMLWIKERALLHFTMYC